MILVLRSLFPPPLVRTVLPRRDRSYYFLVFRSILLLLRVPPPLPYDKSSFSVSPRHTERRFGRPKVLYFVRKIAETADHLFPLPLYPRPATVPLPRLPPLSIQVSNFNVVHELNLIPAIRKYFTSPGRRLPITWASHFSSQEKPFLLHPFYPVGESGRRIAENSHPFKRIIRCPVFFPNILSYVNTRDFLPSPLFRFPELSFLLIRP